eukprot:snap_masked-scaffold_1-processed-gene-3.31-mRNA-1 protein AED:1.00 eAED:1.00 QI:0/0/0/0/1/1/9/0/277
MLCFIVPTKGILSLRDYPEVWNIPLPHQSNNNVKKDVIKDILKLYDILISLIIKREHDKYGNPINPKKFKTEIIRFIKGFQSDKEVSTVWFECCPFDAVKLIYLSCESTARCRFSEKNFKNLQELKILKPNKLNYIFLYFRFDECNIPEVSSFCSFLKSISVRDIDIEEKVQDKVIISAIKIYLKTNEIIKILIYSALYESKKLEEEDIIKLKKIADSHPSILDIRFYDTFVEPKGKSEILKKLVQSALQTQYEKEEVLNEIPLILMGDGRTGKILY